MNLTEYIDNPHKISELKIHDLVVFNSIDNSGYEWVQIFATPWYDIRYNHIVIPFLRKHILDYVFVSSKNVNLQECISDTDISEIYRIIGSWLTVVKNEIYLKTIFNKLTRTLRDININDDVILEIVRLFEADQFARQKRKFEERIHHGAKANKKSRFR